MGNNQNIIELNGQRYEATTGRLLPEENKNDKPQRANNLEAQHKKQGTVMDGVRRPAKPLIHDTPSPRTTATKPKQSHIAEQHRDSTAKASHSVHHKPKRSSTLMRHAVKKPDNAKPQQKSSVSSKQQEPSISQKPKNRIASPNPVRLHRAAQTPRSHLITRYGDVRSDISKRVEPLKVRQEPGANENHSEHTTGLEHARPPLDHSELAAASRFDEALSAAQSHKQPQPKRMPLSQRLSRKLNVSTKALNISIGIFVALTIGGIVAYRNIPEMAIRLAAARSGVPASLPEYEPAGFDISGPVQYTKGIVTLNYSARTDDRNFQIKQQASDWNSQALLDNFVSQQGPYQTIMDRGRTIFIYQENNATWVSGGVWYTIEGSSNLSSDKLLRMVSSL